MIGGNECEGKNMIDNEKYSSRQLNQAQLDKLSKLWIWFHRYALTCIIFISIGIVLGIFCTKAVFERQIERSINVQRFEFKGDLFDVAPSSIQKYYNKNPIPIVYPKK